MDGRFLLVFFDVALLVALGGTIYYLRGVASSIKVIRQGKTELQQVLTQLNIHISNAEHAIDSMKKLADDKAKTLQKQSDTATAIIEELTYIQKAADNVAQRLEKLTGQAGVHVAVTDEAKPVVKSGKQSGSMSKAEKELSDVLAARRSGTNGGDLS